MMAARPPLDDGALLEQINEAYRAAGVVPSNGVLRLYDLVRAYPLTVDEVPKLSHQIAAVHLRAIAGRDVLSAGAPSEELSGMLYANRAGGWILVKKDDPVVRRRFTIAHELGHYLLHFVPLRDAAAEPDGLRFDEQLAAAGDPEELGHAHVSQAPAEPNVMEDEANRFAALLLMPEERCRALVAEHVHLWGRDRAVLARRLSTELLVSQSAMFRRLEALGLPGS